MIRRPSRQRAFRSAAAWVVGLVVIGVVFPTAGLAQPRQPVASAPATVSSSIDCGGDVGGDSPDGPFSISGRVTNGSGVGIEGVRVRVRTVTQPFLRANEFTNPDGNFAIVALSDDDFILSFFDETGTYQNGFWSTSGLVVDPGAATPIDAGTNPAGRNVVLPAEPDPLPTISGTVLDSAGNPASGISVSAVSPDFGTSGCEVTGLDGAYTMTDVRVGSYVVSVSDPNEAQPAGFYASTTPTTHFVTHRSAATPVTVTTNVTGIDIRFPVTYTLSGTIATAGAVGVEGISLQACELAEFGLCSSTTSGPGGTFTIGALVSGSYVVQQDDPSFTYTSGYHADGPIIVADRTDATVISVIGNVTGLSVLAVANPRITGTVTDPGLVALEGIDVSACPVSQEFECLQVSTVADGTFAIGVNPDTYILHISDPAGDHPRGYVGSAGVADADEAGALQVLVGGSDEAIGSVAFAAGARISGVIRKAGGPAPFAPYDLCSSEFDCVTGGESDENGDFRSQAVRSGAYRLGGYTDEDFERIWYVAGSPPVTGFALATTIAVDTIEVTGIDFDATSPSTSGEPTPEGDDVEVVPMDPDSGSTPITLTFDHVSGAGATSLAVTNFGPPAPSGFQLGLPATWFDITTTATFDGEVTVCISYADIAFTDESLLRLFHYDTSTDSWEDQTVSQDLANDVICGRTDAFSPFALFERTMTFTGFLAPIAAPPAVNRAKPGETIPLAFGLGGNFGLSVFAAGSPASQRTDCTTGAPIGAAQPTTSSDKKDVLHYDRKKALYLYDWKTDKSWDGTCRQLIVTFRNGTTADAAFDFGPEPKPPKPPKPPKGH